MSNQLTNPTPYTARLRALRHAVHNALDFAENRHASGDGNREECAHAAYDLLWAELRMALLCNADCPEQETVAVAIGALNMRIPIVGTVGADGAVSCNGGLL